MAGLGLVLGGKNVYETYKLFNSMLKYMHPVVGRMKIRVLFFHYGKLFFVIAYCE